MSLWTAVLLAALFLPVQLECLAAPGAFGEPREPLHLPLVRKRAPERTSEHYAAMADNIRQKYGRPPLNNNAALRKRGNSANVNILNQDMDTTYFAALSVGSP
jgi:cathepsin D